MYLRRFSILSLTFFDIFLTRKRLRVIKCGVDLRVSPAPTHRERSRPQGSQGSGTRPGTPEVVLCLSTTGPLFPQAPVRDKSEDRHESMAASARGAGQARAARSTNPARPIGTRWT